MVEVRVVSTPTALVDEVSTTAKRRAKKFASSIGKRLLTFAGAPVPDALARMSSGGVPIEAFSNRPTPDDISLVVYAATTTNPDRTYNGWREVAAVEVVPVEGRHLGRQSIPAADRLHRIASDLAARLGNHSTS